VREKHWRTSEVFCAMACGCVLARAHSKVSETSAMISGYLGSSNKFDEAMGKFALAYADQAERDSVGAARRRGLYYCAALQPASSRSPPTPS
jgi:hypothetical protein